VDEAWEQFIMACLWSQAPLGLRRDKMFLRFLRADARFRGNGL
jgi:hypothetical protein